MAFSCCDWLGFMESFSNIGNSFAKNYQEFLLDVFFLWYRNKTLLLWLVSLRSKGYNIPDEISRIMQEAKSIVCVGNVNQVKFFSRGNSGEQTPLLTLIFCQFLAENHFLQKLLFLILLVFWTLWSCFWGMKNIPRVSYEYCFVKKTKISFSRLLVWKLNFWGKWKENFAFLSDKQTFFICLYCKLGVSILFHPWSFAWHRKTQLEKVLQTKKKICLCCSCFEHMQVFPGIKNVPRVFDGFFREKNTNYQVSLVSQISEMYNSSASWNFFRISWSWNA